MKNARKLNYIPGIIFTILGIIYLLNSTTGMTGLVIKENIQEGTSGTLGTLFFIIGLFFLSKTRQKKKGQAALEFLMTYGWTILIAILVIGVLTYIGIFKVAPPETLLLTPPLYAEGISIDSQGVELEITNNGPQTIDVTEIEVGTNCEDWTGTERLKPGETMKVEMDCYLDGPINSEVTVTYNKAGSPLSLNSQGTLGVPESNVEEIAVPDDFTNPEITFVSISGDTVDYPEVNLVHDENPGGLDINDNTPDVLITTDEAANCRWDTNDNPYTSMTDDCNGEYGEEYSFSHTCTSPTLVDGQGYDFYVACSDQNGNANDANDNSEILSVEVDTITPTQSNHNPGSGTILPQGTENVFIQFTTDENAYCRWSLTEQEYDNMVGGGGIPPVCAWLGLPPGNPQSIQCSVTGLVPGPNGVNIACADFTDKDPNAEGFVQIQLTVTP